MRTLRYIGCELVVACVLLGAAAGHGQVRLMSVTMSEAQPGDSYAEYFLAKGQWTPGFHSSAVAERVTLTWSGRVGRSYTVETSWSLGTTPFPSNEVSNVSGRYGQSWTACSLPMAGQAGVMAWTSPVPHQRMFFRIREQ